MSLFFQVEKLEKLTGFLYTLGVPHRLLEEDIYEGYLIPKSSLVIVNIWYALHFYLIFVTVL